MREDIKRIMEDAETKQAAYAAKRRAWDWRKIVFIDVTPRPKPEPRTADMQAVVEATRTGG